MNLLLDYILKYNFNKLIISLLSIFIPYISFSQIVVDTTITPQYLVENILVGAGVSVSNITYTGSSMALGLFTNGNSTNIGMDEGIILSTGDATHIVGPNTAPNTQTNTLGGSDPDLANLVTNPIYDAAILEFDFVPMSDTIRFQYIFGSEEYSEWVNTGYNDAFGFFLSGANPSGGNYVSKNLAIVPGTANTVVSINTINNGYSGMGSPSGPCTNCSFYIDNYQGTTIEYDGFTVVLTTWIVVTPCTSYHIKLAIGDGGDHSYDSGVFLKKNSFSSDILHLNTEYTITGLNNKAVEGCNNALVSFTLDNPSPYNRWVHYTVGGTATEGTDYQNIPDSVLMSTGSDSISFYVNPLLDGATEGVENVEIIVETSSCSSDTLLIPIYDYDSLNVQITGNSNFCIGETSILNSNISNGFGPYSYLWNTGSTNTSISESPNANTIYSLQVTDACGMVDSDTISITVNQQPNITASSNPTSVCQGHSATLQVNGASTYSWSPSTGLSSTTGSSITATPITSTTYTVVGTDLNGCKDTTQTILSIKSLPILQTSPNTSSICNGDSIDITANGATTYQWSPASSLTNGNLSSVKAFPNVTTTYTVIGTAANGCQDSTTSIITVNNLPNVQITPANPSLCVGNSKNLIASGATAYLWAPSSSLSSNSGSNISASPITTTTYTVEGTDNNNCKNTDTVILTVYAKPNINVAPASANICEGSSTIINASGGNTYSWAPATGLSATTGSSVTASPIVNTTYTVTGYDIHGCNDTAITQITVSPNPIITASDTVICKGENATLSATASLSGTTFLWSTGSTNGSINVSPNTSTLYHVTATDGNGCIGDDSLNVTVNQLPTISINPANPSICIGNSVSVNASGATTYSWSPTTNNSNVNNATTTLSPSITTTYTVTGIDANGCIDSTNTTITVNSLPNINVSPDIDSICWGSSTTLTASGGSTYHWTPAAGLSAVNTAMVTASPTTPTNYIVSGTDANGCINKDTAIIFVSPVISVSANPPNICLGDSSNLTVTSNISSTYLWNTGQTTSNFWVNPLDTTTYTVTVTTAAGCQRVGTVTVNVYLRPNVIITPDSSSICASESTFLTASGAVNYYWQPNPNLNTLTGSVVSANPTANDSFMVIGEDLSGCRDTAYAKLTVFPELNISVTPGNIYSCQGTAVNLKSSGAQSYSWTPSASLNISTGDSVMASPNTTTAYKVVGIDNNGCRDSVISTVHIYAKPILSINPDTSHLCVGESQVINATGAYTYEWAPASGLSSTTGHNITAGPATTTTYTIIGTSQVGGCKDTATAFVGVHSYPTITLTPAAVQICPQDSTTLTAGGADLYSWSPALGLSDTSNTIVKASPDSTQIYTVIGSNLYGCTDTLSSTITVSPIPVISGNSYICAGDSVTLNVISNLPATTFLWNTGSTATSITIGTLVTTTYAVTATDNGSGCTKDTSFVVNVNAIPTLSVSPNDTTICPGTNVILTAQGGNTYSWSPSSSLSSSVNPNVSASPSSNTVYQLIGSTPAGCKDTVYAQVKLFNQPNVYVNPVISYSCGGGSQILTASGAASYSWAPSTGLSATNGSSVVAGPTSNTIYTVTGIDTNSCSDTAITNIYIYGTPTISPANPSICPEDSVLLTANTQNTPLSYLWSNGDTTSSIYASPSATSIIYVTVTYPGSCNKTEQTSVTVYTDPAVSAATSTADICIGDTVNLTAQNCSSYSWTGQNLISSTGSNVKANPNTDTTYIVRGLSSHSCATFDTVDIHIYPNANVNIATSQTNICLRDTLLLIGNGAQDYTWSPNIYISSQIGDTTRVYPHNNTNYFVIGVDSNGCKDYDTISISVNPGPAVTILPDSPVVCQGDTMNLIASGAETYTWWPLISIANYNNDTANIFPVSNITYNVRGYDSAGCSNDTFVYVNVRRKPFIGVIPNIDSICIGDSIPLKAYGASTYLWQPDSSLSNNTTADVVASPIVTTTYFVIGTSTDGCIRKAYTTIGVHPYPFVTATSSISICKFDTAELVANGAQNYQWSPAGNIITNSSGDTAQASPLLTTTYKTIGTNIYGCQDSAYSTVNVYNLPNVQASTQDTAICIGDSTQLSASGAISYNWSPNIALSSTTNNQVITSTTNTIWYYLNGTDLNNCADADSVKVIVRPRPLLSITSTDSILCSGYHLALTGHSNMNPTTMIWNTGDTAFSINDNPTSNTTYQLKGINTFNCADSTSFDIIVNPSPILEIQPDTIICIGDTISTSTNCNLTYLSYLWSTGDTTMDISLNPIIDSTYTLIATDSIGCADTISTTIRVQSKANLNITANSTHICANSLLTLTANTLYPLVDYQWNIGNNSISNNYYPTSNSIFNLIATDSVGCNYYDTIDIQVNPIPVLQASSQPTFICIGDTAQLSVSSSVNPINLFWTNTSQTTSTISVNPSQTTTYKVLGADSIGCIDSTTINLTVYNLPVLQITPSPSEICFGDSIELQVSSNTSVANYIWNNNIQQASIWVGPNSTTTYSVTVTDIHSCVNDTQQTVIVHPNPIIQIAPAIDTICSFDSTQLLLTSNIPAQSILWSNGDNIANPYFGPMNSSNYSAIFTDTNGCYGYDTAFIYVIQRPTAAITAQSPICSFDSSKIEYQGNGTTNAITNWNFGTANTVIGSGLGVHYAKWNNAGTYQITLDITENGCTSFPDTAVVIVFQSPVVEISANDTIVCDSFAIDFSGYPYGMATYSWDFGDPLALGSDTSDVQNPSYTYTTAGSFGVSLSVISPEGCPGYLYEDALIDVNPVPIADFIIDPPISYSNNPIIHYYDKSSLDVSYWEWDFGDPQSGIYNYTNNVNPYHIFQTKGTYFTQLVVKNPWGCSDTAINVVIIENGPTFYIPDAFTPNGDGLNDLFLPKGTDFIVESYQIYIYERWGSMVFSSADYTKQWNGKHYQTGDELPDGVYSYIIYVTDIHQVKRKFAGMITMYR